MEINKYPLGIYQANCYIIKEGNDVIVIDPAAKADFLIEKIGECNLLAILCTHGHFDHFQAANQLVEHYRCPLFIHQEDAELLSDSKLNYSDHRNVVYTHEISILPTSFMQVGPFQIFILHTPGHSEGSVIYLIEQYAFTGDLLFKNSIGRTDLYRGNQRKLMQSLREVCTLNNSTVIYPGHGPESTLLAEKKSNPYLVNL